MAFKMRSGNGPLAFKNMGSSSPAKADLSKLAQGTQERVDEYDKRGWKHDPTTTGHKDYKPKEEVSERGWESHYPETSNMPAETKKKKPTVKDNYGEGSEKTKRLKSKLTKKDKETEDASVESGKAEAREGKYGKGLFGGSLRRAHAKGKHKRKGRQEDKTREKLGESERYDKLSPEQRAVEKEEKKEASREEMRRTVAGLREYGPGGSGSQTEGKAKYDAGKIAQSNKEKTQASQDIRDARTKQHIEAYDANLKNENELASVPSAAGTEGDVNMTEQQKLAKGNIDARSSEKYKNPKS